ncbi:hypothetical protein A2J03_00400 [Rhodococcus sp. EPR-157]|nr:hypothetical protein A2J03_00400 [Rhodococcus sp. EPR-157]
MNARIGTIRPSAISAYSVRRTVRHLDFFFVFAAEPLSGGSGGSLPELRGGTSSGGPVGGRIGGGAPVERAPGRSAPGRRVFGGCEFTGREFGNAGRPGGGPSGRPWASRGGIAGRP